MATLKKPAALLCDLDGTLVDSVPDLAWSMDRMMTQLGLPARGEAQARQWVGNGVERLVKRALTNHMSDEPDAALFAEALPLFMSIYAENTCRYSRLYPGVQEGLDQLRDASVRLAVVTNKAGIFTENLLSQIGIRDYFEVTVSGDTTPTKKPDPSQLLLAAERLSLPIEACVMLGDSKNDVGAARNAGIPAVCLPYGYNHGEDIALAEPDCIIESMRELGDLFGL